MRHHSVSSRPLDGKGSREEAGQIVAYLDSSVFQAFSPDLVSPLAYVRSKAIWRLPRRKLATPLRLFPMHDVLVVPFTPFLRSVTVVAAEPTHANR
jgi:hypothetical protein